MTSKSKVDIKAFFQTGDSPTEAQFIDLIDSYVDKSGPIGVLETNVSAGSSGVVYASAGDADILSTSDALSRLGITVYTTALASAAFFNNMVATTAQANAGTAKGLIMDPVLVKNAISTQAGSSAIVFISSQTASSSSSIDFTSGIDSTYSEYIVEMVNITPATDSASLTLVTDSNGGASFDVGATDYQETEIAVNSASLAGVVDTAEAYIGIAYTIGNAAEESYCGTLRFFNPAGTTKYKIFVADGTHVDNAGNLKRTLGGGARMNTAAINAIRFIMDSGNIASGTFNLYGVKNS